MVGAFVRGGFKASEVVRSLFFTTICGLRSSPKSKRQGQQPICVRERSSDQCSNKLAPLTRPRTRHTKVRPQKNTTTKVSAQARTHHQQGSVAIGVSERRAAVHIVTYCVSGAILGKFQVLPLIISPEKAVSCNFFPKPKEKRT